MDYVATIIAAAIAGLVGSVIGWLAGRPKAKLDLNLVEAQGVDELVHKIKAAVSQTVEDAATIGTLELQAKIRDARLKEYELRQAEILRDHGAAEERERQCLDRIEQLQERLDAQTSQIAKNKTLTDQVAQQSALLEKLRREGIWKPEPTDLIIQKRTRKDST